jgi:Arylsulfotransferase (ASST)
MTSPDTSPPAGRGDARPWPIIAALSVVVAALVAVAVVNLTRDDDHGGTSTRAASTTPAQPQGATAPATSTAGNLHSRPDLRPPAIDVRTPASGTEPGLILVAPKKVFGAKEVPGEQQGPMLLDDRGRVRWFQPVPEGDEAYDLRVQRYHGRSVLTWWQGRAVAGSGQGVGMIYDAEYQPRARIETGIGAEADIHEFKLTDRGTALMLIYRRGVPRDLRSLGGKKDAKVVDGIVEEIDLDTGKVLLEWHALDHIPLAESHEPLDKLYIDSWDFVHLNSIDVDTDGNLLVSSRHTWTVYKIDRRTGDIIWRLGGKSSDFPLSDDLRFAWQHDARAEPGDRVRIFDNDAASKPVRPASRVITVKVDPDAHTAKLVSSIQHPDGLSAGTQGNAQLLPGGHTFVGWGSQGHFSEFDEQGRMIFDARVQRGYDTYRAYRERWHGSPRGDPALAVTRRGTATTAYVSWNGSTEVQRWQVLTGTSPDDLHASGDPVAWRNLETAIPVADPGAYVAVRALDGRGRTIGRSRVERLPSG